MDGLRQFLEAARTHKLAQGNLRGILTIAVGGRISRGGQLLSAGSTWRGLADLLKALRWDKNQIAELGIDPKTLPPRDRTKYWYQAIVKADLDSPEAMQHAGALKAKFEAVGFEIALPHAGG